MDTTAKLAKCEAAMRRWMTRLTRATNQLRELERQRRRLQLQQQLGIGRPNRPITPKVKEQIETDHVAEADLPAFLDRRNPDIDAAAMTARRRAEEADLRKRMPLSGKAALEAVRPKRKAASKAAAV